jgi:ferredoxin-type protein NapG
MDRRTFFKSGFDTTTRAAVKFADAQVKARARHWIRPPFAIDELEFLLACTRCDQCIEACPHDVIFPLATRLGAQVATTPAMDLLNRGCHLCVDWPCVGACDTGALKLAENEIDRAPDEADVAVRPLPDLARLRIDTQRCLPYLGPECGVCADSCPVEGAMSWSHEKPRIDEQLCTGCALCREACVLQPSAIEIETLA